MVFYGFESTVVLAGESTNGETSIVNIKLLKS